MNPLLTVVVPVFNRSHLIERTLDSIAASTYRPFVLKIIDNTSTDNSLEVCQRWAERNASADGLVIEVLEETKAGAPCARNCGLASCQTPYIYFFDSDDFCSPDFIGDVVKSFEKEDADMLFAPVQMEINGKLKLRAYVENGGLVEQIGSSMLSTHSMVFRTEWLRKIGGWREDLTVWQDWELGIRVLLARPRILWMTTHPYHRVAIHGDSITGSCLSQTLKGTLYATRCVIDEIRNADNITGNEQSRCLLALYYRSMITAGKLRREKNPEGDEAYRQLAAEILPNPNMQAKITGRLLYRYTAAGGRGAWRLIH